MGLIIFKGEPVKFGLKPEHECGDVVRTTHSESGDGKFHLETESRGDCCCLIICLSSFDLSLKGRNLRLTVGEWKRELLFEMVASDVVGVKARLTVEERIKLQENEPLIMELTN